MFQNTALEAMQIDLRIHGHTYEVEATVSGQPDADSRMVFVLGYLRREIACSVTLDQRLVDEVRPPTLDNLCAYIRAQNILCLAC